MVVFFSRCRHIVTQMHKYSPQVVIYKEFKYEQGVSEMRVYFVRLPNFIRSLLLKIWN